MTRDEIVKYAAVIAKFDGKTLIADCPCKENASTLKEYGPCGDPGNRLVTGVNDTGPFLIIPCENHIGTYLQFPDTWEELVLNDNL